MTRYNPDISRSVWMPELLPNFVRAYLIRRTATMHFKESCLLVLNHLPLMVNHPGPPDRALIMHVPYDESSSHDVTAAYVRRCVGKFDLQAALMSFCLYNSSSKPLPAMLLLLHYSVNALIVRRQQNKTSSDQYNTLTSVAQYNTRKPLLLCWPA